MSRCRAIAAALLAASSSAATAQMHDHQAHAATDDGAEAQEADPHAADRMEAAEEPDPHAGHDMGAAPPSLDAPPPPAAFEGPEHAATLFYSEEAMAAAREQVHTNAGGQTWWLAMLERLEYRAQDGNDGYLWDAQGYIGSDLNKLWLKSEGEGAFGEAIEEAEVQALWSHAIGPWFDLQLGLRRDFWAGPERTYLAAGVQGLAPYMFEVDAALFLSDQGELRARVEGEYDQRLTQRLILQPRAELELASEDIPELGIGVRLLQRRGGAAPALRNRARVRPLSRYCLGTRAWRQP